MQRHSRIEASSHPFPIHALLFLNNTFSFPNWSLILSLLRQHSSWIDSSFFQIDGSSFPDWWPSFPDWWLILFRLMAHPFQIDGSSFPDWWFILSRLITHPFQIDCTSFPDWWLIVSRLMAHPFLIVGSSFPDWWLILSRLMLKLLILSIFMPLPIPINAASFLDWCLIHNWSMRLCSLLYPSSFPDWCPVISLLMPHYFLIDVLSCLGPETSREAVGFILAELPGENGLPGMKTLFDIKKNVSYLSNYNLFLLTCTVHPSPVVHVVSW